MTISVRQLIAVVGMTFALIALVIDNVDRGWTVLGTIGVAGFTIAIAAELMGVRRARGHS